MQTNPTAEQWALDLLADIIDIGGLGGPCSEADCVECGKVALKIQAAFAEREARLVGALVAHNDVLRSASQVAYRDGKDTNRLTLRGAITYTLAEHCDTVNEARATLNDRPLTDKIEVTAEDIAAWEKYGPKIFNCEMTGPEALASHRRATLAALKDRTHG